MRKLYLLFAFVFFSVAYGQAPFITTWTVVESNLSIFVPISGENFSIDFGDGTVVTGLSSGISHTYDTEGTYFVSVSGNYDRFYSPAIPVGFNTLSSIEQWGDTQWSTMEEAFKGGQNIYFNAVDTPDLSHVQSMKEAFMGIAANSTLSTLNNWDVSHVTNMEGCFKSSQYDGTLNNWNVSNVTTMKEMFYESAFNSNISDWDVSNVTNMEGMFYDSAAGAFNQPLNTWDVSNVTNMKSMFEWTAFNQPLNNWDVSSVTNMSRMFCNSVINQNLNDWDVSNVTDMSYMFYISGIHAPLDQWDVGNVIDMTRMFYTTSFNQPIGSWDVSNVLSMNSMFEDAEFFNQDLSDWNFNSSVTLNNFLSGTITDIDNLDALLLKFAQLGLENKNFTSQWNLFYCDSAVVNYLVNDLGWYVGAELAESCQGNAIFGTSHYDGNGNGCDTSDLTLSNFLVGANVDGGPFIYTCPVSAGGDYELKVMQNTYNATILNLPEYISVNTETLTFTGFGNEEEVNFCLSANQQVADLNVTLLPIGQARPGFASKYQLIVENIGTQTVPNTAVSLAYDNAKQSFTNAVPAAATATAGQLTFNLANLQPFESRTIAITMQTFTPPTVNGGDIIEFTAAVTPEVADYTPVDNNFVLAQTVVNSFDPNDKEVLQGDQITMEQAEGYLDYIVRFQNTGTASALTVRIEDHLPENVDWTTLRPISSSHPYQVKLKNDNTIEFIFENISLPHEAANEPGSHGFIAYKVKPVETVAVGDVLTGNAEIFFDYNLPIVTNFATTEIVEIMGVAGHIANNVSIYPNPVSDVLNIRTASGISVEEVKVINLQGRELMSFSTDTQSINVENLSAGVYMLMIKTNAGYTKHKLVRK